MINIFELCVNIIEQLIVMIFLTVYFNPKNKGIAGFAGLILGTGAAVTAITYMNSISEYEGVYGLIMILIYIIYSSLFLKGDIHTKVFISGCSDCVICISSLLSLLTASMIFGFDYNSMLDFSIYRVGIIVLAKLILVLFLFLMLKFKVVSISNDKLKRVYFILMFLPVAVDLSMAQMATLFVMYTELNRNIMIVSLSSIVSIIAAYYIFVKITYNEKIISEYITLRQKYESDKQHSNEIKELYARMCGLRHDLIIFFQTALSYLKADPSKAEKYIESIINDNLNETGNFVKSDNECFNAITDVKVSICRKRGIYVKINIMNGVLNKLNDSEIGVIFGNLFDNAIRAAEASTEKTIELEVKRAGEYLSIVMMNSVDKSILNENVTLETTKNDRAFHGYGIKNIKRIVSNYDGMMNFFEEDGFFGCQILV